ncbi:MAG: ATP synthase F1 subunit delta [Candidatus Abyssobacteria bacterium SURF_17]|uniref:ATP synthase subunit delta n=1 Tax=Candidatus Abyssobacteria bacterium SURF_17 TaxID=2093361 RepID=A0A419EPP6_9BACT|nr:MAG: ATP synthase F1 subunit delta [Candidatus Abyssubacteria bacterium SURF_17]
MKVDPIVSAYAESLFRVATAEGVADRVEEELHDLERLYQTSYELKEFINNPTVKAEGKKNALTELMGDKLSRVTLNHMNLLVDQDRGRMFPKVAEEYYRLSSAVRAKVSAEVITAVPISDGALEQLGVQLKKLTRKDVYLRTRVDESIIGGVVVKVGDKVLDGSVRSKLAQMRKQMAG